MGFRARRAQALPGNHHAARRLCRRQHDRRNPVRALGTLPLRLEPGPQQHRDLQRRSIRRAESSVRSAGSRRTAAPRVSSVSIRPGACFTRPISTATTSWCSPSMLQPVSSRPLAKRSKPGVPPASFSPALENSLDRIERHLSGTRNSTADFNGGNPTSDGGLVLLREAERKLGFLPVAHGPPSGVCDPT
jgi:hypothetical protein